MKKIFLLLVCFVFFCVPTRANAAGLKVHFVDIGEGDCIILQSKGENMIIDFGHKSNYQKLQHYLNKHNIKKFKYSMLTHPHYDHMGGMKRFLNDYEAGSVFMPMPTCTRPMYKDIVKTCNKKKLAILHAKTGDAYKVGDANVKIVHTGLTKPGLNYNNYCTVVRVTYQKNSFLLLGDATQDEEKLIIKGNIKYKADVVKVAHHGAKSGSSKRFLKKTKAKYAVVSCGKENKLGHPSTSKLKEINKLGMKIYRTDSQGSIVATCTGKKIKWSVKPTKNLKGRGK